MKQTSSSILKFIFSAIFSLILLGCQPAVVIEEPYATEEASVTSYMTPFAPEAVTGITFPVVPVSDSWLTYSNQTMGLSIQYPPDWQIVEQADHLVVSFIPPGVDPQLPSSQIGLIYIPDRPFTGQPVIETGSEIHPILVVGSSSAIQYEDSKYAIPTESYYIEFSYKGGTLLIKATKGPTENLVPQFNEMLKTLNLSAANVGIKDPTPKPLTEQTFAFSHNCSGYWNIFSLKLDGSSPIRLTNSSADEGDPIISPDEESIAFFSEQNGDREIYTMNKDGSNLMQLTSSPGWDGLPTWSPDKQKIAFTSWRDGIMGIFIMNNDGSEVNKITTSSTQDWMPSWSPDGQQIAFSSYLDYENYEIFVINPDGSSRTQLTALGGKNLGPRWSPDGKQIAFYFESQFENQIIVMDRDGSNMHVVYQAPGVSPATWTADSKKIILSLSDGGFYSINEDGSDLILINDMESGCN